MWKWLAKLLQMSSVEDKKGSGMEVKEESSFKGDRVYEILNCAKIRELIFDLQFNEDEKYVAFRLSRAFEQEGIVLNINELEFFKVLVRRISTTNLSKPLMNETELLNMMEDLYYHYVNDTYSSALYSICFNSSIAGRTVASGCSGSVGYVADHDCMAGDSLYLREDGNLSTEPSGVPISKESIQELEFSLFSKDKGTNKVEDTRSLDEILNETKSSLK